jgi:phytoene dehydrogenase-like protein
MGVTERAIDWFWRSAMLALLNLPLERCSAASMMRIFRLMLGRSGYHFGFPRVGLSALYVPGCTAAIRQRGGQVVTGAAVRSLQLEGGAVSGVQLRDGSLLHANTCVLALPPWHLRSLLARTGEPAFAGLQEAAGRFAGVPYLCSYLWLDRRVTRQRFWARVWNPDDLNTDFYDLANIRPDLGAGSSVIACNAIGPNVRPHWSDEQVIAGTVREVAEFAPQAREARVLHARVHRIRCAIPQPRPGTEALRPGNATAVRGVLLAGDWTDTGIPCSMESAARSAALAADAILGGSRALPAPETWGLPALLRRRQPKP